MIDLTREELAEALELTSYEEKSKLEKRILDIIDSKMKLRYDREEYQKAVNAISSCCEIKKKLDSGRSWEIFSDLTYVYTKYSLKRYKSVEEFENAFAMLVKLANAFLGVAIDGHRQTFESRSGKKNFSYIIFYQNNDFIIEATYNEKLSDKECDTFEIKSYVN